MLRAEDLKNLLHEPDVGEEDAYLLVLATDPLGPKSPQQIQAIGRSVGYLFEGRIDFAHVPAPLRRYAIKTPSGHELTQQGRERVEQLIRRIGEARAGGQAVVDASGASEVEAPTWAMIVGCIFGGITLVFFMTLVILAIMGFAVPTGAEWLVYIVLGLSAGLSAGFVGGHAAARGRLPLPFLNDHPIEFGVGGGIAALIIVLVVTALLHDLWARENGPPPNGDPEVTLDVQPNENGSATLAFKFHDLPDDRNADKLVLHLKRTKGPADITGAPSEKVKPAIYDILIPANADLGEILTFETELRLKKTEGDPYALAEVTLWWELTGTSIEFEVTPSYFDGRGERLDIPTKPDEKVMITLHSHESTDARPARYP